MCGGTLCRSRNIPEQDVKENCYRSTMIDHFVKSSLHTTDKFYFFIR